MSRYRLDNYLMVFDFPNPSFTAEQRFSSNVPLQQLYFMNNPFVYKQAGMLADACEKEADRRSADRKAYEYLFQRKPTADELQLGLKFLSTTPEKPGYTVERQTHHCVERVCARAAQLKRISICELMTSSGAAVSAAAEENEDDS